MALNNSIEELLSNNPDMIHMDMYDVACELIDECAEFAHLSTDELTDAIVAVRGH